MNYAVQLNSEKYLQPQKSSRQLQEQQQISFFNFFPVFIFRNKLKKNHRNNKTKDNDTEIACCFYKWIDSKIPVFVIIIVLLLSTVHSSTYTELMA